MSGSKVEFRHFLFLRLSSFCLRSKQTSCAGWAAAFAGSLSALCFLKPVAAASQRSGRMTDMRWPRLPRCCAALLSWGATSRRAQQRSHRCNFGELDKLHLVKKGISHKRGFWCFSARFGVCACVRMCSAVGLLYLSLSVCLRAVDRGFGVVDERVWSALLVKTRESSLGLRSPPASRIKMKIL